ncbi:MAG: winged helix DNA-binding domain-containing protein [Bacteroidota bacterium]|nr:winged helix DNA-binding domain-containing protein [Bacteroidota bacterium]
MNLSNISNLRLINQQIAESKFKTAKDVVGWMGAMQAQDYAMSKWAIGIRLPNSTDTIIESAIDNGEIIRTHLLRPTWHFVSSDDIYWMLDLTAPQIKTITKSRNKDLGLTETVFKQSNSIIEKVLRDGNHLTREELVAEFVKAGIPVDNNRASHLLLRAEIEGLLCSGKTKANKQTYALLPERVVKTRNLTRDEALAELARKYFISHCPATLQDFVWWSGLSVSKAKQAMETIKSGFISETINDKTYWFTNSFSISGSDKDKIHLLPAYDEFIISYRDRTPSLPFEFHKKAVSNNGLFWPTIVINGQVTGIWKRTIKKDKVLLETNFFDPQNNAAKNGILKAFSPFGMFINKEIEIIQSL